MKDFDSEEESYQPSFKRKHMVGNSPPSHDMGGLDILGSSMRVDLKAAPPCEVVHRQVVD